MYCQLDAAAFGAHHQHVALRAVRRTEGLGRTGQRGGHRRHIECTEIGEIVERASRRIRAPVLPLAIAIREVLFDVTVVGGDACPVHRLTIRVSRKKRHHLWLF
jgi:hypothetical protein